MIKPVGLPPLMVVSFEIDKEFAVAFNDFYNKKFLPDLLALSPELRSIQRFEAFQPETMAATGAYQTFYQLDSLETLAKTDAIFGKAEFAETLLQFRHFKERALLEFSRVNYEPIYNAEAPASSTGLQQPAVEYCCLVRQNVDPGREEEFLNRYVETYLPGVLAAAPDLLACHVFKACEPAYLSILTIYQAADLDGLRMALSALAKTCAADEPQALRSILTLP
ncbi:MAG: hypothetical protein JSS86_12490 [Cyanobacteria bacterium SZAS LIN-2]|nr:hypothetical protein [Cyanobacteria bacterium SZAS LIN-2]